MPHELGLLGATGIAARAMIMPSSRNLGLRVRAVAASSAERATAYAAEYGIPVAHNSYQAMLADDTIEAVYVSVHNSAHAQWAVEAALAGKHVIVEKPLCLNRREAQAISAAAASSGVHVVEALMTMGQPWQDEVRALIDSGELGGLTDVSMWLGFGMPTGFRLRPDLGGGAFLDAGSYWLQTLQAVVGTEDTLISGRSEFDGPNRVDLAFEATLDWRSGIRANLECGFGRGYTADVRFACTKASLRITNFLRPAAGRLPVNLVVEPHDGPLRVRSVPASHYYDDQFARIVATLDAKPADDQLDDALWRVAAMEDAYRDALQ